MIAKAILALRLSLKFPRIAVIGVSKIEDKYPVDKTVNGIALTPSKQILANKEQKNTNGAICRSFRSFRLSLTATAFQKP